MAAPRPFALTSVIQYKKTPTSTKKTTIRTTINNCLFLLSDFILSVIGRLRVFPCKMSHSPLKNIYKLCFAEKKLTTTTVNNKCKNVT